MIKLTRLDGSEVYLNPDLIETIEETPDTHITLSNGKSYLFLEPAKVVIGRIVSYRARLLRRASGEGTKKYLYRRDPERYNPLCTL
ncbi:flagellar protein FlbD [Geomonas silvestris]|uniref:Flagellar protein FlbD n=1 Tax=Geomonas silvestris TaxID=2740184 RepID=A0A6V8MGE5_9BACT|nr:flagellar FlbD family protein [Geomonas silvestris]GFO59056.1 flagellar protein FlbD [Geomonas silvestris]